MGENAIEAQDINGAWSPVSADSTFEIKGTLESMDPWQVGGTEFETRESTEIEAVLQNGELVKVRGMILEDGTWVALSIERVEEDAAPTIILIGEVTSMDPWVVNEITLNVTEDTVISGDIALGTLVRVEILLGEDGTWEVLSIAPLGELPEEEGCVTVLATFVSTNAGQVQFLGWPAGVTLGEGVEAENGNSNESSIDIDRLNEGQTVLAVLCLVNGQIVVTQIILVDTEDGDETGSPGQEKVLICHKPDKKGGHTISVAEPAVLAHLGHGDILGPCP
jgi:hypothetical protein